MTKIDIISGFLGAGKTTLIKTLLQDAFAGQQVVLIENEFGEIGIDGGFLREAGIEIKEMNSGCICCSLVGDFGTALQEVVSQYHPDRIIIEPSGVGKLSDVIRAVENVRLGDDVVLNSATTVVDVLKCKMYLQNFGEFFTNQVEAAGTVVLSRTDTDKATEEKVAQAVEMIRALNPTASIVTTPAQTLGGRKVLEIMEGMKLDLEAILRKQQEEAEEHERLHHHHHHDHDEDEHEHHHHDEDDDEDEHEHHHHHDDDDDEDEHEHEHHHHHHDDDDDDEDEHEHHHHHHHDHHHHDADEVFDSWGTESAKKYTREELEHILQELSEGEGYGIILRAKGMVQSPEGSWLHFDMVPGEYEVREGSAEYTGRFCVIGSKLEEEKIKALWQM